MATSQGKIILYSYWRSSCSWRVRIDDALKNPRTQQNDWQNDCDLPNQVGEIQKTGIFSSNILKYCLRGFHRGRSMHTAIALNLKEIPHEIKPVSLIKAGGEQHSNEYRELNPMEQVPALHIDGVTLIESMNILHYLEETRPHRPLLPNDVVKRAKVREICEVIVSGIQPLQNLCVLIHVGEEKKDEWAKHWINRGFRAVEKLLASSAGKYSVGDEITLADCCLIPQVFNARRFHVDLRPFPIILRIDRELENYPAFIASHPSSQPDCPQEAHR